MSEPNYVVLRCPAIPRLDGRWMDRGFIGVRMPWDEIYPFAAVFEPTDEFERRDDGAVAQVYRLRPEIFRLRKGAAPQGER